MLKEEPRLFDAILAYDDDILSAWGPFYHKILIDIVEEEHVHKFLSDFFNVQDVGKMWKRFWKTWYSAEERMLLSSPIREVKLKYEYVHCWGCVFFTTLK